MRVTLKRNKVVIVGGGITGLTTAYYLQQKTKAHNLPIDIVLIEASLRLGGKIHTVRQNGYIIERGPGFNRFLIQVAVSESWHVI